MRRGAGLGGGPARAAAAARDAARRAPETQRLMEEAERRGLERLDRGRDGGAAARGARVVAGRRERGRRTRGSRRCGAAQRHPE